MSDYTPTHVICIVHTQATSRLLPSYDKASADMILDILFKVMSIL